MTFELDDDFGFVSFEKQHSDSISYAEQVRKQMMETIESSQVVEIEIGSQKKPLTCEICFDQGYEFKGPHRGFSHRRHLESHKHIHLEALSKNELCPKCQSEHIFCTCTKQACKICKIGSKVTILSPDNDVEFSKQPSEIVKPTLTDHGTLKIHFKKCRDHMRRRRQKKQEDETRMALEAQNQKDFRKGQILEKEKVDERELSAKKVVSSDEQQYRACNRGAQYYRSDVPLHRIENQQYVDIHTYYSIQYTKHVGQIMTDCENRVRNLQFQVKQQNVQLNELKVEHDNVLSSNDMMNILLDRLNMNQDGLIQMLIEKIDLKSYDGESTAENFRRQEKINLKTESNGFQIKIETVVEDEQLSL